MVLVGKLENAVICACYIFLGTPVIIVGITVGVALDQYGDKK